MAEMTVQKLIDEMEWLGPPLGNPVYLSVGDAFVRADHVRRLDDSVVIVGVPVVPTPSTEEPQP